MTSPNAMDGPPVPAAGPVERIECRVCYADTDAMGIVYYARYLRWFEMGRTEWLRTRGIPYQDLEHHGIRLPVSEAHCQYRAPARYDQRLMIETRTDPSVRGSLRFDYRILAAPTDEPLAVGYTRHAFVDHDYRVIRPPRWLRIKLAPRGPTD